MSENIITIAELEAITTAPGSSYIPVDNGTTTNKITVDNFVASSNTTAVAYATAAESYAKGGTESRTGEDTDNAKYYKEQAASSASTIAASIADATELVGTAVAAKNSANSYAGQAAGSASQAALSATAAAGSAGAAAGSATSASGYASTASSAASSASSSAADALGYKDAALGYKNDSADSATLSESYAVGGTSSRSGEDTDNAKYYKEQAETAAESAEAVAVKTPYIGDNDNWYVWDTDEDDYVDSGVEARGDKGEDGQPGEDGADGVSPAVTIASITGGHSVTITDEEHPSGQSFNVMDGADGQDGTDGTDGVSPEVTITPITGGTQVTITDADHPSGQSFNVLNGSGSGDMTASVYDDDSAVATAGGIADYVGDQIDVITGYVTPQMYGAVGDGQTDDTTAIGTAITQAMTQGKALYIPTGEYIVKAGLEKTLTNDLVIYGDSENDSLLKVVYDDPTLVRALMFYGVTTPYTLNISNLGIKHITNTGDSAPTVQTTLLSIRGIYNNILFDHVYIHAGGNASTLPEINLAWCEAGATLVKCTNSIFENFTNQEVGSCLWINPSWSTNYYDIYDIMVENNTFRNTNQDEAFAAWIRGGDTHYGLHNVLCNGNTFIHKDWNGTCAASSNIISIASKTDGTGDKLKGNLDIKNNQFDITRLNTRVFHLVSLEEINIQNNSFIIRSVVGEGDALIYVDNDVDNLNIINNTIVCAATDKRLTFNTHGSGVLLSGNTIKNGYNRIALFCGTTANSHMIAKNNSFNQVITTFIDGSNQTSSDIVIEGNMFESGIMLGNMHGGTIKVRNNTFNALTNSRYDAFATSVNGALIVENNQNLRLTFYNNDSSTPITDKTNFTYLDKKSRLRFMIDNVTVEDSAAVRAMFFSSNDIIYTDAPTKADKVTSATNGNFAGLDSNGNLTDSGKSASNFAKAPTVLTQTLAASGTSVTFTNIPTSGNNIIDFFIEGGANYTAINTATAGQVTLTYEASSSARTVYCRIEEVS